MKNTKTVKIYEIDGHKTNHLDEGENTSVIALAAKYCDYYVSDVVYDINAFMNAVENAEEYDRYLCFYDMGVHGVSEERLIDTNLGYCDVFERGRACYHLTYDPETRTQKLTRVSVYVSRGF